MTTLRYAQVFVRGASRAEVESALAAILSRDGYAPFDAARIPPGYPAEAREFDRWRVGGPDEAGTVTLLAADVRLAFGRAGEMAAALPSALVVALVRPAAEPLRAKAYRDGTLALKVGNDPDDELFYHPIPAEGPAVAAFLQAWGSPPAEDAAPEGFARHLGVIRADRSYDEAASAWPAPLLEAVFASRRSRLFRES